MSDGPEHYDVVVIGYGPVGAAIGVLLGRYGVTALVVDKAPGIFMAPRAIALDNEALRILQMIGIAEDAFEKIAVPYVRMHCPYVGEFSRSETSGCIDGHPRLVTFYQPDLERALRGQVAKHDNVTILLDTEMACFDEDANGVTVELKRGSGDAFSVCAHYLVGADGASSRVRDAIGQQFDGKTYAEDWLIVDAHDVPGAFDHVEFLCDPARPTPHMVAPGGRIRWEFMLQPGETREEMEKDETIVRLLAPWAGDGDLKVERKAVYRFHARSCDRYSRGRVFLAGDAAHITPPFAGQGLVAGLRDAANLAWKLAWVTQGRASPAVLESYDGERRPHANKMIRMAKLVGHLIMPRNRPMAILIHGTMALLRRMPVAGGYLGRMGFKPRNAFPRGLFVAGRARLKRGSQLPQGLVRTAAGDVVLSDEALGDGLALIGFGIGPDEHLSAATRAMWAAKGGRIVQFCQRGESLRRGAEAFEDLDNRLVPDGAPYGWCAVVRPDRTILHDGPVASADDIVRDALTLLSGSTICEQVTAPVNYEWRDASAISADASSLTFKSAIWGESPADPNRRLG